MPPKVRITREEIIAAAVGLVRESGAQALNARTVAAALQCSTQPVFSNFSTMEALRAAVIEAAEVLCGEYIQRESACGDLPPYKASGMAYIRFAREERELFKLLYMRDRTDEAIPAEHRLTGQMTDLVHANTGLEGETVQLFHLEMWAYVHGIAAMFATGYLDLDWDLVSRMLTDAYRGLRKQFGVEA
ncbi:MAG: WHG domain-containing protein [Clostridia bacterium]|nr:WHG domain-containing protein [Clostridia bacterium]